MSFRLKYHYSKAVCIISFGLLLTFCKSDIPKKNKFSDPGIVKIDEQRFNYWRTHLLNSLSLPNPAYQAEAIMAFASMNDATPFKKISESFSTSESPQVRAAAAFYLGRINGPTAMRILLNAVQAEKDPAVKTQILSALSKSISPPEVAAILHAVSDKNVGVREAGYLSFIQIAKRGIHNPSFVSLAITSLSSKTESLSVRWLASYTLSVSDSASILPVSAEIKSFLNQGPDTLSANLLTALAKVDNPENMSVFLTYLASTQWQHRVNSLQGLKNLSFAEKNEVFAKTLLDSNSTVRLSASGILKYNRNQFKNFNYFDAAQNQKIDWRVRLDLLEAQYLQHAEVKIIDYLINLYKTSDNAYEKARCAELIGLDPDSFDFLSQELLNSKPPVTAGIAWALVKLDVKNSARVDDNAFSAVYKKGIATGDPALATIFANAWLMRERISVQDTAAIAKAYHHFLSTKEIEVAQTLKQVMDMAGQKTTHPFPKIPVKSPDWAAIKGISNDQKVKIKTTKGDVIVRMLIDDAPVAVSNFLQLVNDNYYDSTYIYYSGTAGVLNGGCKRGDGYGKKDYTLPFEASQKVFTQPTLNIHRTGYFESTQWYMLIDPLSARQGNTITIGVVETNSDILAQLSTGDQVLSITLLK